MQVDLSVPDEAITFFFSPDETLEKIPDDRPTQPKTLLTFKGNKKMEYVLSIGGSFKGFFIFTPNFLGNDQIVELIFFGWVGSTTN